MSELDSQESNSPSSPSIKETSKVKKPSSITTTSKSSASTKKISSSKKQASSSSSCSSSAINHSGKRKADDSIDQSDKNDEVVEVGCTVSYTVQEAECIKKKQFEGLCLDKLKHLADKVIDYLNENKDSNSKKIPKSLKGTSKPKIKLFLESNWNILDEHVIPKLQTEVQPPPKKVMKKSLEADKDYGKILNTHSLQEDDEQPVDVDTSVAVFLNGGLIGYGTVVQDEDGALGVDDCLNVEMLAILNQNCGYELNATFLLNKKDLVRKEWIVEERFSSAEEFLQATIKQPTKKTNQQVQSKKKELSSKDTSGNSSSNSSTASQELVLQLKQQNKVLQEKIKALTEVSQEKNKEVAQLKKELEKAKKNQTDSDYVKLGRQAFAFVKSRKKAMQKQDPSSLVDFEIRWNGVTKNVKLEACKQRELTCGTSKAIIPFLLLLDKNFHIIPSNTTYKLPSDRSSERKDRTSLDGRLYSQMKEEIRQQLGIDSIDTNMITKFLDGKAEQAAIEEEKKEPNQTNMLEEALRDEESQGTSNLY